MKDPGISLLGIPLVVVTFFALIAFIIRCAPDTPTLPEKLHASCAATCKHGVASFEYHGQSDFKCVCVEPLGAVVE